MSAPHLLGQPLRPGSRDPARNALIVTTYAELQSLKQTAVRFGITKQRVSQILRRSYPSGAVSLKRGAA